MQARVTRSLTVLVLTLGWRVGVGRPSGKRTSAGGRAIAA